MIFSLSNLTNTSLFAQDVSNYIKIGGSINLSDNFYSSSGIDRRQPANVARGILRTTVQFMTKFNYLLNFTYQHRKENFSSRLINLELVHAFQIG
ncbi:MAG: hypothetical protein KatS3mg036_0652 [Ignavibacterium sp.]|nr:MAG: hypothetical protein KatS3mg036_0652 [Ignavibacterium sp.]